MSRVEQLEKQIAELTPTELRTLREWFARYDADVCDRQIESDVENGKVSRLMERARRDHDAGLSTKL